MNRPGKVYAWLTPPRSDDAKMPPMNHSPRFSCPHRLLALALGLAACLPATAQETGRLPDMGSSAAELITPAQERAYGQQMFGELRRLGWLIEDPLIDDWLDGMGQRLVSNSERPEQRHSFFMLRSREINAFATLGGYIGLNAGLVLTAEREDEVAAVLAHEISHVTQRHVVRAVERAQKDTLPILLGMLGAIVVAQSAGDDGNATQAAIASGIALMQQRQINHTRASEHEADRIGIQTLARSGYDPGAMAGFFARLQRAVRLQGEGPPEFLRTHPVTTTRISEAKERADKLAGGQACTLDADGRTLCTWTPATDSAAVRAQSPLHPGFPVALREALDSVQNGGDDRFDWARERLRVLSAQPAEVLTEYRRLADGGATLSDPQRYGMALAQTSAGQADQALATLQTLALRHPDSLWIDLALARAWQQHGDWAAAERQYEDLLAQRPRHRAISLAYAEALARRGDLASGLRAQAVLRPLLQAAGHDAALQHAFARASETAGDLIRASEAYAENAFLSGRPEDALNQLQRLQQRDDLDYVQRARIDARITSITPIVLEQRSRRLRPGGSEFSVGPLAALR